MLDEQDAELLAEWLASDEPHQTPLGQAIHRALVGCLRSLRYSVADGARDPNALAVLARDPCPCARYRVARNPATGADVLEGLAADDDWSVREAVARHPSCPAHVRAMLQADAHEDVRAAAQGKTPRHVAIHDALMAQQARERLRGLL